MDTRIVNKDGRLTLGKELIDHLGVLPGEQIEAEFLPHGVIRLSAAPKAGQASARAQGGRGQKSKPA